MKKREQGVLTVEASIILTLCTMLMLFLFSFARMYNAQSLVSHAVLQSSDAVALESYLRETSFNSNEADVVDMANKLTGSNSVSADSFTSLRSADIPKIAKEKFVYAIADSESEADEKLKSLGIKDGLAGVDFSGSRMELGNDDVIVYANYKLKMQFPIFGMDEISVSKAAKSKTFGGILFGIETIAEDPHMGSASGGGNYNFGTEIQISATPNYGYKFIKWDDGNTDNPRTVTVTGPKTYIAIFEQDEFGVNVAVTPENAGTASGGGRYKYLETATVSATPSAGYHFAKWSVYKHNDKQYSTVNTQSMTFAVDQTYTCTAYFEPNSYNIKTRTEGTTSGNAYIVANGSNVTSVSAKYNSNFTLVAPNISGYRFLGWKIDGASNYFSSALSVAMTVPARDITYVACYESLVRTVRFYDHDNKLYAVRTVNTGSALGSNLPPDPKYVGQIFNGWSNFDRNTRVYSDMDVHSNWRTCTRHRIGNCNADHTITAFKLNSHHSPGSTVVCRCIVCADCGCYLDGNGNKVTGKYANGKSWRVPGGSIVIAPYVWCVRHQNPSGNCSSFMYNNSDGTYPLH